MKKYLFLVFLLVFGITGVAGAHKYPPPNNYRPSYNSAPPAQIQARQVLQRTAKYLTEAQRISRYGGHHKGLGYAVSHQRRAHELFREGWYERTIAHSIRARKIAIRIIQDNRGRIEDRRPFDDFDERFFRIYSDKELDGAINFKVVDDDSALTIRIDFRD